MSRDEEIRNFGILFFGVVIGFFLGLIVYGFVLDDSPYLGNAICSENNMGKFIYYDNEIVHCEQIENVKKYDGIYIKEDKE